MDGVGLNAVFVSYRAFVAKTHGGVQTCTHEYIAAIEQAGFLLTTCLFQSDRGIWTRIRRRLMSSPYRGVAEPNLVSRIVTAVKQVDAEFIFLNQVALASLAPALRSQLPGCKIIILSHGLESTDILHSLRLRRRLPITSMATPFPSHVLGSALLHESAYRPYVEAVFVISPFDGDLERWLGTRNVIFVPRIINSSPLTWKPTKNHFGFVGTLDHAPNLEGLVQVLNAMSDQTLPSIRIRVVGGPKRLGDWLAKTYNTVDYLGPLEDAELIGEAATWNAFIHPIFCLARGCSTKLATALGWHIPIVTTQFGQRGYAWRRGGMVLGDNPDDFVRRCIELLDYDKAVSARSEVITAAENSPTLAENALLLRSALANIADH